MQKGNSVEDQAEQITGFAKENGMELIEIRKIQASGKKQLLNVGELSEVIKQAKQLAAEIVVTKIDRISRDQITLLMLKKQAMKVELKFMSLQWVGKSAKLVILNFR